MARDAPVPGQSHRLKLELTCHGSASAVFVCFCPKAAIERVLDKAATHYFCLPSGRSAALALAGPRGWELRGARSAAIFGCWRSLCPPNSSTNAVQLLGFVPLLPVTDCPTHGTTHVHLPGGCPPCPSRPARVGRTSPATGAGREVAGSVQGCGPFRLSICAKCQRT